MCEQKLVIGFHISYYASYKFLLKHIPLCNLPSSSFSAEIIGAVILICSFSRSRVSHTS